VFQAVCALTLVKSVLSNGHNSTAAPGHMPSHSTMPMPSNGTMGNHTMGNHTMGNHTMGNHTMGNHTSPHGNMTHNHNMTNHNHTNHNMTHNHNMTNHNNHSNHNMSNHNNMTHGHSNHNAQSNGTSNSEHTEHTGHSGHSGTEGLTDHSSHSGSSHSMGMFFESGHRVDSILFENWKANSDTNYALSLLAVFFLAWVFELIRLGARPMISRLAKEALAPKNVVIGVDGMFSKGDELPPLPPSRFSGYHVADTILYAAQMTLGYLLMLITMTYNVGLFVMVIVGLTCGHFALAPPAGSTDTVDTTDCCG